MYRITGPNNSNSVLVLLVSTTMYHHIFLSYARQITVMRNIVFIISYNYKEITLRRTHKLRFSEDVPHTTAWMSDICY